MRRNGNKKNNTQPPAISVAPINRVTLRFVAQAASGPTGNLVSTQDLFDILCIATSSTAAKRIVSALRVRKIELWGAPVSSSTGAANLVGIRDLSITPVGGRNQTLFDEHLGADRPAHVVFRPSKGSMAANWLTSSSVNSLFTYFCSPGSIVDLSFDYLIGYESGTAVMLSVGAAITAALGVMYVRSMDSNNTGNLVPSGLIYQTA